MGEGFIFRGFDFIRELNFEFYEYFNGSLDGRGNVISNLFINGSASGSGGLFSELASGSEVRDLGLEDVSIVGGPRVGALAGRSRGVVSGVWSSGAVSAATTGGILSARAAGGLVGENLSEISSSYSTASVEAPSLGSSIGTAGGLAGVNSGTISDSYASGSVTATSDVFDVYAGGIVGDNADGTITRSHATGDVTARGVEYTVAGGLVATNTGDISSAYATGNVSSEPHRPRSGRRRLRRLQCRRHRRGLCDRICRCEREQRSVRRWFCRRQRGRYHQSRIRKRRRLREQ